MNSMKVQFSQFIDLFKNQLEIKTKLTRIFQCVVCYEVRLNMFYCCPFCCIYLGCYSCTKRCKKCPMCQHAFEANSIKAYFIPGIEEVVEISNVIPEVPPDNDDLIEDNGGGGGGGGGEVLWMIHYHIHRF